MAQKGVAPRNPRFPITSPGELAQSVSVSKRVTVAPSAAVFRPNAATAVIAPVMPAASPPVVTAVSAQVRPVASGIKTATAAPTLAQYIAAKANNVAATVAKNAHAGSVPRATTPLANSVSVNIPARAKTVAVASSTVKASTLANRFNLSGRGTLPVVKPVGSAPGGSTRLSQLLNVPTVAGTAPATAAAHKVTAIPRSPAVAVQPRTAALPAAHITLADPVQPVVTANARTANLAMTAVNQVSSTIASPLLSAQTATAAAGTTYAPRAGNAASVYVGASSVNLSQNEILILALAAVAVAYFWKGGALSL